MSQLSLEPYLKLLAEKEGSDLYFSSGTTPAVKIQGEMRFIGKDRLRSGQVEELARSVLNQHQIDEFLETLELNVALSRPGIGRFRMNVFQQRGEWSLVIRYIQAEIPRAADLNLPLVVEELITERRGLILVVGATGSGKSTTLASMIDYRAEARPGHILTVEDPMEYAFRHRNSVVNQREVGVDTRSYAAALKEALREAPDVIMIGEVRDRATMEHALAYADTGHLCISTLHATNANQALDRIIRFFPSESRDQLLMDLSLNLKAIISQRLIIGSGGKRLPAVEILINTPLVSDLIKRGEIDAIKESMQKNTSSGAMTFDMSILELHKKGLITREEALANADSRSNMEWLISFGSGQDELKAAAADSSGIKSDSSDSNELPPLE
ncbi:PilT/PilU family type 4a pilus ATPase [Guyparkeria hydrothermalis]|uniref:PilT/PilU family type 4a pilus ATPase n=1 Tax=Guyparkeria hydrothermalis TaxID=923 RepID=UPI0020210246|nr:PilT/PilU family type 4a pilus ATPase [Guyparkeria hydrothermalis]MCL7744630.1 PilT/PilU family type 4a pilus ATPase [Guyparkeria hydrothermalis]